MRWTKELLGFYFLEFWENQLNCSSNSSNLAFTSESMVDDISLEFSTSSIVSLVVGWNEDCDPEEVLVKSDTNGV